MFVVEQNRDAQLRTLLVNELEIDPAKLTRVLHFDGTPITARFISGAIADKVDELKVVPFRKARAMTFFPSQAASSRAADNCTRLYAARLRRCGLHAVRRLRP